MSLKELKEQAFKLSPGDRLELVSAIIKSLQIRLILSKTVLMQFNECEAY